jgi:hypothetical protein
MKKMGLLLIVLVVALGSLGVAYAAWAQDLTIENTVNTGYISASFADYSVGTDPYADLSAVIEGSGATDADLNSLNDELNVTIDDAYPGFSQTIYFKVVNNGTVPFYLTPDAAIVKHGSDVVTNIATVTPDISDAVIVEPAATSDWYSYYLYIPGEGTDSFVDPEQCDTYIVTIPLTATQNQVD